MNRPGAASKVLIVEDDEEVRFGLSDGLQRQGYDVVVASDGTGAIQRLLDYPEIGTIVSDIRMPTLGGDYWLGFLRQFCAGRYRIILASAREVDPLPEGMQMLRKPYKLADLVTLLKNPG